MERDEESRDGNEGLKLLGGGTLVFPLLAAKGWGALMGLVARSAPILLGIRRRGLPPKVVWVWLSTRISLQSTHISQQESITHCSLMVFLDADRGPFTTTRELYKYT